MGSIEAVFVNDKRFKEVPGPNVYATPAKDKLQAASWSLPRNQRFKARSVRQPGPGEYEYSTFTQAGPKFTTRVKPFIDPFKMKTKPGPGEYSPDKAKVDFKYSMGARPSQSMNKLTPGPGAYGDERALHYRTIPGSKMGKDNRKSNHFLHTSSYQKQEPGRYNQHEFANNRLMGVPNFSFGRDQRFKQIGKDGMSKTTTGKMFRPTSTPGPGAYEYQKVVGYSNSQRF